MGCERFPGRQHQGATDPFNAALNYGYGILYQRVQRAVTLAGLCAGIGYLHVAERGRPALVFDLVEEFRAWMVDRPVLNLATRGEPLALGGDGRLDEPTRCGVAHHVTERMATPTSHHGVHLDFDHIVAAQLELLVEALQGRRTYRAFSPVW